MFRNHDVIRYQISGSTWCRHGLAVVYTSAMGRTAKDTYWGCGDVSFDSCWLNDGEIDSGTVIGNTDDFKPNKYVEYDDFADEDKFYIPVGGGSEQNWIRTGAAPKPELIYKRLSEEAEQAWSEVHSTVRRAAYKKRLLAEHVAKFPESVHLMEKESNEPAQV